MTAKSASKATARKAWVASSKCRELAGTDRLVKSHEKCECKHCRCDHAGDSAFV